VDNKLKDIKAVYLASHRKRSGETNQIDTDKKNSRKRMKVCSINTIHIWNISTTVRYEATHCGQWPNQGISKQHSVCMYLHVVLPVRTCRRVESQTD